MKVLGLIENTKTKKQKKDRGVLTHMPASARTRARAQGPKNFYFHASLQ
jgi:hypothetical protein